MPLDADLLEPVRIRNKFLMAMGVPVALLVAQIATVNYFIRELQAAVTFISAGHAVIEADFEAAERVTALRERIKQLPSRSVAIPTGQGSEAEALETAWTELAALIRVVGSSDAVLEVEAGAVEAVARAFNEATEEYERTQAVLASGAADLSPLVERAIYTDRALAELAEALALLAVGLRAQLQLAVDHEREIHDRPVVAGVAVGGLVAVLLLAFAWLYVDRHLAARLTGLSRSMLAVAGGNLRVPLPPPGSSDEIDEMTRALTVFRDTAVEIEDNSLREVARARRRLVDAIESASEGFAFYDANDRLEMCNSRFRELSYAGGRDTIQPGVPFETIARSAIERDGAARKLGREEVERLVRERIERHRNPVEPFLQRRADGRWIQISERRTQDGGAVAVYTDLTGLKENEQRAAAANHLVLESLQYASRIQSAILPARGALASAAADHLLIWEPRDIVGGDFFWFRRVQDGYLVLVGDCTGHGVPGAFMTLIATGVLERLARDGGEAKAPSRLLADLHRELQALLGQHHGHNGETDDGLDAGLCRIDEAGRRLVFAGARLSLWRTRAGVVDEFRGARCGLGYPRLAADLPLKDQALDLAEGDAFYFATDGLLEQVGGPRRRAFGRRRFAAFLAAHHRRPMPEQAAALAETFASYQGDEARRDDLTVLGFAPLAA